MLTHTNKTQTRRPRSRHVWTWTYTCKWFKIMISSVGGAYWGTHVSRGSTFLINWVAIKFSRPRTQCVSAGLTHCVWCCLWIKRRNFNYLHKKKTIFLIFTIASSTCLVGSIRTLFSIFISVLNDLSALTFEWLCWYCLVTEWQVACVIWRLQIFGQFSSYGTMCIITGIQHKETPEKSS